jgi:hypothetical protein
MSTAGIYNYHPNVEHQGAFLNNQMKSHQKPFFFGASQVPIGLMQELNGSQGHYDIDGQGFNSTTHKLFRNKKYILPSSNIRR